MEINMETTWKLSITEIYSNKYEVFEKDVWDIHLGYRPSHLQMVFQSLLFIKERFRHDIWDIKVTEIENGFKMTLFVEGSKFYYRVQLEEFILGQELRLEPFLTSSHSGIRKLMREFLEFKV